MSNIASWAYPSIPHPERSTVPERLGHDDLEHGSYRFFGRYYTIDIPSCIDVCHGSASVEHNDS